MISKRNAIHIYSFHKDIYIRTQGNQTNVGKVKIYNILGKEIVSKNLENVLLNKITINNAAGNYIVRVILDDKVYTEKVNIK